MNELSIHHVAKIEAGPINDQGWRSIYITDEKGNKFEVSCFGKRENLGVQVSEKVVII